MTIEKIRNNVIRKNRSNRINTHLYAINPKI